MTIAEKLTKDPFQEILDDPSVPFDVRWRIIQEIDRTNEIYFIFRLFMRNWNLHLSKILNDQSAVYKILEIGPGSGTLGLKILDWAMKRKINLQYNLFDSQEEVLNECSKKYSNFPATLKLKASENYLKDYADNSFDVTLSLHVLHHIQPKEIAMDALEQMFRVSRKAVVIMDFQKTQKFLFRFTLLNFILGFSSELISDGVKSMQRAYTLEELTPHLNYLCDKYGFELKTKKFLLHPYWFICAVKKTT